MKCALYLAQPWPPFSILREIRTASDVDRIRSIQEAGKLSFRMSKAEGVDPYGRAVHNLFENPRFEEPLELMIRRTSSTTARDLLKRRHITNFSGLPDERTKWMLSGPGASGTIDLFFRRLDDSLFLCHVGERIFWGIWMLPDAVTSGIYTQGIHWFDKDGAAVSSSHGVGFGAGTVTLTGGNPWGFHWMTAVAPANAVGFQVCVEETGGWSAAETISFTRAIIMREDGAFTPPSGSSWPHGQNPPPGILSSSPHRPPVGDMIREGSAIVDVSDAGVPSSLWFVRRLVEDSEDGMIDVDCVEWRQLLAERQVPSGSLMKKGSAPALGRAIMDITNGYNPTYIRNCPASVAFNVVSEQPINVSNLSAARALDAIAKRCDAEWWIEYRPRRGGAFLLDPCLIWGRRRGVDRRNSVHLVEGVHLSRSAYKRDARQVPRYAAVIQVPVIASQSGETATVTPTGPTPTGKRQGTRRPRDPQVGFKEQGNRVEKHTGFRKERGRRGTVKRTGYGPALQSERVAFDSSIGLVSGRGSMKTPHQSRPPKVSETATLVSSAYGLIQRPIVGFEAVELVVRDTSPPLAGSGESYSSRRRPWGFFDLGDLISVRLTTPEFGNGVDLDVRVLAMQPDEAAGELVLVVEVLPS